MKIVIEGYDGTGKSTLVKALAERLGLEVHSAGPPPLDDAVAIYDSIVQFKIQNVVHDRITPISRQAYQLDIGTRHRVVLEFMTDLFSEKTVLVFCTNNDQFDIDHVTKEYDTAEHISHITDNKAQICDNYERIFKNIDHIRYDFRDTSIDMVIDMIIDEWEEMECQ